MFLLATQERVRKSVRATGVVLYCVYVRVFFSIRCYKRRTSMKPSREHAVVISHLLQKVVSLNACDKCINCN